MLNGSINRPLERAEDTTSEPPEHLFSAGFHLNYLPEKLEAKLCHLRSSCPPVQQRKMTHCDVIAMQISLPVSSLSDSSESTSHGAAAFPHRELAAGDLTVIHWYPAFTKEGCKLLILQ